MPSRRRSKLWFVPVGLAAASIAAAVAFSAVLAGGAEPEIRSGVPVPGLGTPLPPRGLAASTLDELLALPPDRLTEVDLDRMNLLVATGLPGAEELKLDAALAEIDRWATHVRTETERHMYRFHQNPSAFEDSEGYFRMLTLVTVLQQDFGARYNPDRIYDPDFRDSRDLFIHGLIGETKGDGMMKIRNSLGNSTSSLTTAE